jgi:hypothetical protein
MDHIVRVLTTGKPLEGINQGIVDAIQRGSRVLVKAGSLSANFPELTPSEIDRPQKLDSENSAIASWAEKFSQQHGLVWQRVGPDVLFTRTIPEILKKK